MSGIWLSLPGFTRDGSLLVRRSAAGSAPYALFERRIPTHREIRKVTARGYGIHLIHPPTLSWLENVAALTHLSVTAIDDIDTRPIENLASLRELQISAVEVPETDLSRLPRLHSYSGHLESFESVLRAPSLVSASFDDVQAAQLPPLPSTLEQLSLSVARRVRRLPDVPKGANSRLRTLSVHGSRRFDVASLTAYPQLESIFFASVAVVQNIGAVPTRKLRMLTLMGCRSVEGVESLARIRGIEVTVIGALAEKVRAAGRAAQPQWTLQLRG